MAACAARAGIRSPPRSSPPAQVMEAFLGTLAIAIITALAYLAYKHPKGYQLLFGPLWRSVVAVLGAMVVWNFGGASVWATGRIVQTFALG